VGIWIAAGLLIACLVLARLPRRDVQGRGLALLRTLFPSWRFFEEIEAGPSLQVATAAVGEPFGAWRDAQPASPRTAAALLVNARGNLELAYQSLVDQLTSELDDAPQDPTASITYALVQRLVEVECLSVAECAPGQRYRFRLHTGAASGDRDFVSAEHVVGAA
jgi:hypothetical protein